MSRCFTCLALVLLSLPAPVRAQEESKEAPPLLETWQAAYFEGLKVGHMHTLAREVERDGKKVIRTQVEMNLVVKRYGNVVPIRIDQVSEETDKGKVLSLGMTHYLTRDVKKTMNGVVKGDKLALTTSGDDTETMLPWDDEAVGYYGQHALFDRKKVKTGDRLKVVTYELMLPGVIRYNYSVKDTEKVDRLVPKKEGAAAKFVREPVALLRVDMVPEKIVVGETPVQLPTNVVWLNSKLAPVRQQFEMPGLGLLTLYNTTKKAALEEGVAPELLPDLGLTVSIPVATTLDDPYKTNSAVYRVTLKEDIPKVFAEDARQEVRDRKDKTFELAVKAIRGPAAEEGARPGKEFLESNQFIDSDDARVKATAVRVVGTEADAWKKALKLEKWVHDNMKPSGAQGFPASASQVCRDLEGDCRQHAMLLAGLCRAARVPSRTAIGLVYAREEGRRPVFAFHMWTEVWVGRWVALDATLGEGSVGATHLKMVDASWSKTATLAPLLPVSRALGKVQIEIVSAK
jgi:transglutaminase-like putative cysteine protease